LAQNLGGGEAARHQAYRRAFDITFAAGDLTRETQTRLSLHAERGVQQFGAVDKRIAVNAAKTCEFGVFKAGNHAEDAGLFGVFQLRLETHYIVESAQRVILA